jgi:hypothetical protein
MNLEILKLFQCCLTGLGRDYSKPECKKSKLLRLERKKKKLEERGLDPKEINATLQPASKKNVEKSLEEFLAEADAMPNQVHNLKVIYLFIFFICLTWYDLQGDDAL